MSINTTKLLSGRAPVVPYANLSTTRYEFLALGEAEPNLGAGADNSILTISTNNTRVWANSVTLSSVSVSGNITANGLISATGNVKGGNITTGGVVSATGNVTGNFILGNGSQLTGIITSVSNVVNGGSNLDIATANANVTISVSTVGNVAVFSPTGVKISGTISANGNTNIANISIVNTTFTSTDSNGNLILFAGTGGIGIPAGNTSQRPVSPPVGVTRFNTITSSIETWDGAAWVTSGNSITPGTIVDQQITPDGVSNSYLLVQPSTAAEILVAINGVNQVPTLSYTVTGTTITFSQIPMSSDIIDIRFITYLTSVSSLSNSSGNSVVNITPSGNIQFTTANNLFATMTASSFNVNYPISTTGNITAPNFIGNLIGNISGNITIPGSNTQVLYNINGNIGAAPGFTFDSAANALLVTGTVTGGNLVTSGVVSATGSITSDANITGVQFIGSGSTLSNIQGGNVSGTVSRATLADTAYAVSGANVSGTVANATYAASSGFAGTVTENAQSNITSLGTLTSLSVTGNTRSGNLLTSGLISASGVVTGSSHLGAVVSASGNIIGGNLVTAGLVSATGSITTAANITGGNLLTSGLISATSTITSTANIIGGNIATAGSLTATGNISGGNFLTAGIVSATGNITAPYFVGNLIGNISGNLIVPGANTQVIYNNTGQANASAGLTFDFASNSLVSTGTVTGSNLLTVGYVSAAGNVIGNRIIGNGATLSSITGANVSGNVANATYAVSAGSAVGTAATVTANAQPNITSVGTLTSLAVTANVTGGNILTAGQISSTGNITTAGYFVGTLFGNVTGNITIPGLNTQVIYNNNGNAGASAGFTFDSAANALVLTGTVTGSNFLTGGYVSAAGNIIGNYIIGNGATLSSITAANINGTVANATYAISSGTSATVTTNSQPNITSVGTLTSLAVTSNVTGGNLLTGGYISATGNITTAGYFFGTFAGNISGNLTVPGANTQVIYNNNGNAGASAGLTFNSASNAMVVTGTVTGSNFLTGGYVSAAGNIIGNNIIGNGSLLSSLTGANVSGTVANATYATSAGYSATVTSNAQGNITSLGTLTSLTVTANTQTGNLLTGGYISAAGNIITAGVFVGTFAGNISGNLTVPGANTQVIYNNSGNAGASAGLTFNSASNAMVVTGTVTGGNILTGGLISSTGAITGSSHLGAVVSVTGNVTGNYLIGNGSILSSITGANVSGTVANATAATYAATITTNAQPNITSVGTLTSLTVTANVTGGNILTAGLISSTGNITGGNLSVGTGIITVGNIVNSNGNAVGNIGSSSNYFNTVFAQATSALYADLAENYLADAEYTPGTVLSFGGEEELTISTQDNDPLIAGIISTNPAYQMNSGLTGKFVVALALAGRVPCLVQGPVTAGAMMVSAGNGRARAEINPKMGTVIGKAITGFAGNLGVIEILVGRL